MSQQLYSCGMPTCNKKNCPRNKWGHMRNSQQPLKLECPSVGEWINKLGSICTMEYYSDVKRSELWTQRTMQMHFKCIMLVKEARLKRLCDSVFCDLLEETKVLEQKADQLLPGAGKWGTGEFFTMEMFCVDCGGCYLLCMFRTVH